MPEDTVGIVSDSGMPRVCVRMPSSQRQEIERLVEQGRFPNASEAIRYAIRSQVSQRHDDTLR